MKTKIAYLLVLLVAGALVSFQRSPATEQGTPSSMKTTIANGLPVMDAKAVVHYQVKLVFSNDVTPCGAYLVEVTNGVGSKVTAPQLYIVGRDTYFFTEQAHAGMGLRVAKLVRVMPPSREEFCPSWMWANPDSKNLMLQDGEAYSFNLVIKIHGQG